MKKLLLFLLLFCSAAHAADNARSYYVPPTQFNAALEVMDTGFANTFILFRIATGSFSFDDAAKSISNLRIALDTTSLVAGNEGTQHELSGMLDAFQYPEMRVTALDNVTFTDGKATIKATLTLHGVAKPVTLDATLNRTGKSKAGGGMWTSEGDAVGISLRGVFKRADFGLGDNPENPTRFGDAVTLRLEMQAIQQ